MVNAMFRSAANRTPLDRGRTLLRYAKREVGTMDVLEEVIEDNFVREKMAGRSNAWWAGNFRKLQEEMKMPGAFLPDAGDVTDGHVIEAVSKLVKSDLLARAEKLGVSDWLKSFLRMIAKWVDEAMALCRLGRMFNELAAAGRLDGDFVREIHDFTGKTADYFKDLQEGGARDAVHGAVAAAVAVEDAADMRRLGLDAASFSMVDDSLDKADGDGVEFGYDERDAGSKDADAAFTSIEVDGRDSGGSSGGGEGMQRGRDSEFLPDDAATGTADRADGSELLHSVARRVERLGVRRHRVSRRDLDLARQHGFYTEDIVEVASDAEGASLFRECIEAGKASQVPYGECVYTYEAEEYAQMRLFLTPDGSAGFALKDGDMVSVFATKGSKLPGKPSLTMVALAVTQGATKGDCYGTMLPALYARFGFRAVARDEFNAEFSPESMQEPGHMERFYAKYNGGKPDIVYMVWDGSSRDSVIRDYDEDAASEFTLLPYAKAEGEDESAYDACVRIQNGVVEQFRGRYDAEELVSARESGDPMRLAAAMRGLRLSKADLKARDLVRGKMGSAATVGSLAGDALYGAFAEGKVPLVAAARIAAAAPMNDMLQEAALAELEHGELEQALATMQAMAALGASLDMEKTRAMGAYALKKQEEKQKELDDARAKKMKLSEQDELLPLMAERERWRNWPVHPEMVAEVLDGVFGGGSSFSVKMDDAFSLLTPSRKVKGHAVFVNTILENIRRDVELWRRYEGLALTEREKALVAVGRAVNLVQAVAGFLPQKYRFSVNPYLRKLQVFSELATTGDLDFTRPIATLKEQSMEELRGQYPSGSLDDMVKEYGERKLHEVMTELLQKTAGKLQRWGKDGVVKEIERVLDSVKPAVDEKSKMYKRGAVSAEALRKVQEVEKLMEMGSEEKEAELERLDAALEKAWNEGDTGSELEKELLTVAWFGNLDGMDMDQAAVAHEKLKELVTFERFAWDDVLERRRQEQKGVVSRVVRMFGGRPDRNRLHRAMEEKPRRDWKHLSQVLESMPQMLLQLERHDATREFGKAMRGRITDAGLSIKHAQKRRTRKVLALSKKFLGRKYWKAMRDLKEVHDTGIDTKRQVRRKVETTVSNARRLLEMTAEEREAERRRSAVEGGVMAADELTEQDVAEIGRFLEAREADAAAYERERMEWERMSAEDRSVTPVPKRPRDVKRIAFSYVSGVEDWKNIRLSKGQALYVILMSEQAHYSENLASQGFTEETLDALREWIGDGMVQFGYGLRDLFAEQGEKIAGVYEEAYGVPFPRVENYFAARFDVARMDSAEAEVLKGSGAMPGGGKGFMKLRQLHYHNVDLSRDALSVFMEATEISDNWLYTQDIVADFRAYFSDEAFKDAMIVNMGRDNYENMKQWVAMIETMGARQAVNMGAADRMTNRIYSGSAMAILGYKFETIVRQASGILNGWAGDPTIGFAEWMATMARMKHGKAPMTISRMAASEVMQDRYMGMLQLVSSQTRERHEKDLNGVQAVLQVGMNAMEKVDVLSNAVGMAAVYNIHYARAQKAGMTESEADVAGWGAVRDSLSMAAQPQQWMDRTKIAQMKSPLGKALLFMMSENFNKVGLFSSLFKSGGKQAKKKAFKVWAAYGVFNALIGALLDFIKEDPDEWEKREWWGYIWSAVCGPLSGVPVVGEALEWAVDGAFKAFGIDAKVYIGSSARGVIDLKSGGRAVFNLYEMMFGDKEGEFEDYVKECVRLSRMGGVVGGAIGGTAGSAVILGSALMNPVKTATNFWHSLGLSD